VEGAKRFFKLVEMKKNGRI